MMKKLTILVALLAGGITWAQTKQTIAHKKQIESYLSNLKETRSIEGINTFSHVILMLIRQLPKDEQQHYSDLLTKAILEAKVRIAVYEKIKYVLPQEKEFIPEWEESYLEDVD